MALTAQGAPGATGRRRWPLRQTSIAVLLLVLGAGATSAQTQGANLAEQGDIFTPTSTVQFKRALRLVMTAQTWAVVMDDNPGEFSHRINGTYSKARPRSSMPYSILAQLPTLPDGIEYRFLGRHLVLHDTHANVILDRIRHAIQCSDCD